MSVKSAIEAIKPDEKLISDTEKLLRRSISKNKFKINKLVIAACLPIILGVLSFSFCAYNLSVAYISFDVNPSLELGINWFNRVVDVNYFNNDAKNLILEKELYSLKPSDAINLIMEEADKKGYLSNSKTNFVTIAVNSNQSGKSIELLDECVKSIDNSSKSIIVISDKVSGELKKEADSLSLSSGKLKLIKVVQQLNESATVESLKDYSITDIMDDISYLTSNEYIGADDKTKESIKNYIKSIQTKVDANTKTNNQIDMQTAKPNIDAEKAHANDAIADEQAKVEAEKAQVEAADVKAAAEVTKLQAEDTTEQIKNEAEIMQAEAAAVKATAEEAKVQVEATAEQAKAEAEKLQVEAALLKAAAEAEKLQAEAIAEQAEAEATKVQAEAAATKAAAEAAAEAAKSQAEAAAQATTDAEKAQVDAASAKAAGEAAKSQAEATAAQAATDAEKAQADAASAKAAGEAAKSQAEVAAAQAATDAEKAQADAAAAKAAAEAAMSQAGAHK